MTEPTPTPDPTPRHHDVRRECPAPIKVLAVLNVVVGLLGMTLCGCVAFLNLTGVAPPLGGKRGGSVAIEPHANLYPVVLVALNGAYLFLTPALRRLRPLARRAEILLAGVTLLVIVAALLYEVGYVIPTLRSRSLTGKSMTNPLLDTPIGVELPMLVLLGSLLLALQSFLALVILVSPLVAEAFLKPREDALRRDA